MTSESDFCQGGTCVNVTALHSIVIHFTLHVQKLYDYGVEAFLFTGIYVPQHMYVRVYHHRSVQEWVCLLAPSVEAQFHCLCLLWLYEWLHNSVFHVNVHIPSSTPCPAPIFLPARFLLLCKKAVLGILAWGESKAVECGPSVRMNMRDWGRGGVAVYAPVGVCAWVVESVLLLF